MVVQAELAEPEDHRPLERVRHSKHSKPTAYIARSASYRRPARIARFSGMPLEDLIDATAQAEDFSGVVRVDRRGTTEVAKAYGYADRAYGIANTVDTQFGTASATKTFTALTVMALVEEGRLDLSTTARSLLGDDLPEIADDVTVEQLLAHRSGIGDYFDENGLDDMTGYPCRFRCISCRPPRSTSKSWPAMRRCSPPARASPTTTVAYVVLALLVERAGGAGYHEAGSAHVSRTCRHGSTRRSCGPTSCQHGPRAGTSPSTGSGPTCCISPSSG